MAVRTEHVECARHGIDDAEIQRRLALFGLGPDVDPLLARTRALLRPHLDAIVDAFYAQLHALPELSKLLGDAERTHRLRGTQRAYLEALGEGRQTLAYFEARLRIGHTHERVGLAPTHYLGAYTRLATIVYEVLAAHVPATEAAEASLAAQRVFWLDAELAMLAYHGRRHEAVIDRARLDVLTGVATRGFLLEQLADECTRAERQARAFTVIFVDLDGFKTINDELGHAEGDRILVEVGDCIRRAVRPTDVVGRYGGDEFVIGLVGGTAEHAREVAARVAALVAQRLAGEPRPLTASFGIAVRRAGDDVLALVDRADAAMYEAKRAGKARVVVENPDAPPRSRRESNRELAREGGPRQDR